MSEIKASLRLEINGVETKVTVWGTYYPGTNGNYYDQPEPPEIEINKIHFDGRQVEAFAGFTDEHYEEMENALWEAKAAQNKGQFEHEF
jgi:hypothetical protein